MEKRTSAIARIIAVLALAAAVVAVVMVASGAVDDDPADKGNGKQHHAKQKQKQRPPRTTEKTYEIQPGDTLGRIAYKTGTTVQELKALNPETDPLGLIAGEVLKLR